MGLLDKASKVISAPKVERYGESLYVPLVAREQAKHDGHPDQAIAYLDVLKAAIESAAIKVERKTLFSITNPNGHPARVEKKGLHVRRSDYAAWLQSIGEPPPDWWILEGETVHQADESQQQQPKRAPGRPEDPAALANRMDKLREDAIEAARVIGGNPQVQQVANHLTKHGWSGYAFDTIKRSLRKTWWQSLKESQK